MERPETSSEALVELLDSVRQDLRLVIRTFARQKGWTAVAIVTLGLGVGANSTLFTIINAVILRPAPVRESRSDHLDLGERQRVSTERSCRRRHSSSGNARRDRSSPWPPRAPPRRSSPVTTRPRRVTGARVSAAYFSVLGVAPARGRTFSEDEDRAGGPSVVMLSDQLWRRVFGADPRDPRHHHLARR